MYGAEEMEMMMDKMVGAEMNIKMLAKICYR